MDCRAINMETVKVKFSILVIDELLDELFGSVEFSKLDLRFRCHQVRANPNDILKIAFRTYDEHSEFLVLCPLGLPTLLPLFKT